jgi:hypothetical protein
MPTTDVGPACWLPEDEPPPLFDDDPLSLAAVAGVDDWYVGAAGADAAGAELDEALAPPEDLDGGGVAGLDGCGRAT